MSSKWTFGTVNIYVSDDNLTREIMRAEIKILDATQYTLQFFGAGSRKHKIKGVVIGSTDWSNLENYAITDSTQSFTGAWGLIGSYKISNLQSSLIKYAGGTIDGIDVDVTVTPLYEVELELVEA